MASQTTPNCEDFFNIIASLAKFTVSPLPLLSYQLPLSCIHITNVSFRTIPKRISRSVQPSYWKCSSDVPIKNITFSRLLEETSEKYGDRRALVSVFENEEYTFSEVKKTADELAAGFYGLGLKKGDKVALWGPNSARWYIVALACLQSGLVMVCLNHSYKKMEVERCLRAVGVKALVITHEHLRMQSYYSIIKAIIPEIESMPSRQRLNYAPLPNLDYIIINSEKLLPGTYQFEDLKNYVTKQSVQQLEEIKKNISPLEGCNIQFTSGTSGHPKAVHLSHRTMINNGFFIGRRLHFHEKEHRICLQVPFFHTFGTVVGISVALNSGTTLVLPSPTFQALESVRAIEKEKCTVLYGTPTMYIDVVKIVQSLSKFDNQSPQISSLETAFTSGAIMTQSVMKKIKNTLKIQRIVSAYGMTEAGPLAFVSKLTDSEWELHNTVGSVLDHSEVKVTNERNEIVPMGEMGECHFKGYNVMLNYYNDEEATKNAISEDGWLRSGDVATMLPGGYLQVIGRIKDIIIRGGETIIPQEIEEYLQTHPDVLEAQVYGAADERLGEIVCCSIRLVDDSQMTEDDIRKYCEGNIAHFKIPKIIRFVKEFPKTTSGKVQKYKLTEMIDQDLREKAI